MSLARNRRRLALSRPSRSAIGVVSIHSSTASESPRDSITGQRLAQACGSTDEQRLVIHWKNPYDNCLIPPAPMKDRICTDPALSVRVGISSAIIRVASDRATIDVTTAEIEDRHRTLFDGLWTKP